MQTTLDPFVIYVDNREIKGSVVKYLKDLGVKIIFEQLGIGDYVVGDFVIERKTIKDFVNSIVDGRLFSQAKELKENYKNPLIIIEGLESLYNVRGVHSNAIRGAVASLIIDFHIPIIRTENGEDTARFIYFMAKRLWGEKRKPSIVKKKPGNTIKEIQENIVASFPNIGLNTAQNLLRTFGNLRNLFNASIIDLKKVEGVGEKRAKEIFKIINQKYEG